MAGQGLEGMNQKGSHGGDQVRKGFGDCGEELRRVLEVIWREEEGVNERTSCRDAKI